MQVQMHAIEERSNFFYGFFNRKSLDILLKNFCKNKTSNYEHWDKEEAVEFLVKYKLQEQYGKDLYAQFIAYTKAEDEEDEPEPEEEDELEPEPEEEEEPEPEPEPEPEEEEDEPEEEEQSEEEKQLYQLRIKIRNSNEEYIKQALDILFPYAKFHINPKLFNSIDDIKTKVLTSDNAIGIVIVTDNYDKIYVGKKIGRNDITYYDVIAKLIEKGYSHKNFRINDFLCRGLDRTNNCYMFKMKTENIHNLFV